MINTQYINLNMVPSGVMPVLYVSQYDIGRPLGVVVYNGGESVDLDTYTCTIEATRTDGTAITAAVTTDDNIGAFVTTATMTNKADRYPAKLVLFDSNSRRVASLAFVMCVTPKTMDENAESIEEDRSLYQQYTDAVQAALADIRENIANLNDRLDESVETLGTSLDNTLDHFGTFHNPYLVVYGDVAYRGRWSSAQGLVLWGNYLIAINAYDSADGGAVSSANGCDIIVMDKNLVVQRTYEACAVGHGGGSCVLNNKLYICGDVYDYRYIITEIDLADLVAGTYTARQLPMDQSNAIYSIATDGTYLYGSNGVNIWKFTPDTSATPTLQCRLPISTTQDITIQGTNLFVVSYTSTYQRNRVEVFDLRTGAYIDELLLPYRMGAEFKEIQTIVNVGTGDDPKWLAYFNSDTTGSNYILQIQFRRSLTTAVTSYVNDSFLPYPFEDRANSIFYKPSYHGIMYGTAAHPYNSENLVQRAVYEADRYCYIRPMEDIDSLTIISASRQLYIGSIESEDYNHAIGALNLYYCDIVDVVCPVTTITAYKVNVLQYSNDTVADATLDYVGRFISVCSGLRVTHTRNSHIEALKNIYISDNADSTLEWIVQSDGIDCTRNIVTGIVHKDNAGTTNGTPTASRGILEINTNIGLPNRFDAVTFKFTTITGLVYTMSWYKQTGTTAWTKTAWTQVQPVST